jgi:hypothetical protein
MAKRRSNWEDYPTPVVDSDSGCLRWQGPHSKAGYGLLGGNKLAHREAWEREHGPIPEGLTIDHVRAWGCIWRDCVLTAHMELVTQAENARRGRRPHGEWTHCRRNHPFSPENTYITSLGSRQCRACKKAGRKKAPSGV